MRFVFLLAAVSLLALLARATPSPDTAALRLNRLPADGLELQRGWRYHPGDNPTWARPDFDDRAWDTLNPARPRRALPARLTAGLGWLRLRYAVGDSLRRRALLLQISCNGAMELYLDGRLVRRDGTLHPDPTRVQINPNTPEPLALPGASGQVHVLAVRFAPYEPPPWQLGRDAFPPLSFRLFTAPDVRRQTAERTRAGTQFLVLTGIFGLLTLLHLVFFRFNPARRANLYFGFYAGSLALCVWTHSYFAGTTDFSSVAQSIALQLVGNGLQFLSYLWAVRALYALFGYRPGRLYHGLWGAAGLVLTWNTLYVFNDYLSSIAAIAFVGLAIAEQLRLTAKAWRARQRGIWLIGTGFAVGLLSFLVGFALVLTGILSNVLPFLSLSYLAPALGISLFLAREFALDAQQLLVKLGEVETLSVRALAQEQEKQALLAQQNETLETQVQQRTAQLEQSLADLQAAQAQLVQQEKMAFLGELTAGIAHELQNPLTFMKNFAEVSTELVDEMGGPRPAAGLEGEILAGLKQNLREISQHGQRATAIIAGMLEHARAGTGPRVPTPLNALVEDSLRLAYQGLRAQDRDFRAHLTTALDPALPLVAVVPQDLGRVLINLLTNAFHAVRQRQQAGEAGYRPEVHVQTSAGPGGVEIRIADNGPGMSAAVQAKIFQPFFTTKPAGEGTGLGLSLSHDIITQGHGGTLGVESREGQGTTFSVALPLNGHVYSRLK
jgi:two-component system NtrC family sensor kinase